MLYGPPASGKDTVTLALAALDPRYVLFPRLKVGSGATATYRMTTSDVLNSLRSRGELVWENYRYGATYAVDRPELVRALADHRPVLHLGQTAAIRAVRTATTGARWFVVGLWCPRHVARERLIHRGATDVAARLQAWDETEPLTDADATLNTADISPAEAAATIHSRLSAGTAAAGS
jgi:guanylate kinase